MARCVLTTSLDHVYMERLEVEAKKRGVTVSALAREKLVAALSDPDDITVAEVQGVADRG